MKIFEAGDATSRRPPTTPGQSATAGAASGGSPTAAADPSAITTPAYNPDYTKIIASDPIYQGILRSVGTQGVTDAATRQQALRQLVVQYGGVPAGFNDQYGDIDQGTIEAANANPYSVVKQLANQHAGNQANLQATLAATGTLSSGALTSGLAQEGGRYGQSAYEATNTAAGNVGSVIGQYNSNEAARQAQAAAAASDAATRAQNNPANYPQPGVNAALDPNLRGPGGEPVYTDSSGNHWTRDKTGAVVQLAAVYTYNPTPPPVTQQAATGVPSPLPSSSPGIAAPVGGNDALSRYINNRIPNSRWWA